MSLPRYEALLQELRAIEKRIGVDLVDTCIDAENVSDPSDDYGFYSTAADSAAQRAHDAGYDINALIGRIIF